MAAKLTRLTHKIVIQLDLVAESCTIPTSSSRRPVRKLLDTPSYVFMHACTKYVCIIFHKVKEKLPLCLTKHHAIKTCGGVLL
jgi:hypothetical protein